MMKIDLLSIEKQCKKFPLPQIGAMFIDLFRFFGPQGWWPAESIFEVCIGAILTQNTSWNNVEKVIKKLKAQKLLSPEKLYKLKDEDLAVYIRSSGYYKQKTKTLKNFLTFLFTYYNANLKKMFRQDGTILRKQLLNIKGIGQETADSILLYASNKLIFVVDAYTKRIAIGHSLVNHNTGYQEIQQLFSKNLPPDVNLFNEYHALLVRVGKTYCAAKNPTCQDCPLLRHL
jgi:endonuclease-3 related protein